MVYNFPVAVVVKAVVALAVVAVVVSVDTAVAVVVVAVADVIVCARCLYIIPSVRKFPLF